MFLVLCETADVGALALARAVRRTGAPCVVATSDLLSFARRRSQRIGIGGIESTIELTDGTVITRPAFVLNRLMGPPAAAWRWAAAAERDYAAAELTAFMLSWLAALDCPVRNRPDPSCLAGPAPHPLVLAAAATRAGLDCPDVAVGHRPGSWPDVQLEAAARGSGPGARPRHVVCLDGEVVGDGIPVRVAQGVRKFAAAIGAGEALIGVDFLVRGDRWWFAGMTPVADLAVGGAALRDRLVCLAMEPAL